MPGEPARTTTRAPSHWTSALRAACEESRRVEAALTLQRALRRGGLLRHGFVLI